MSCSPVDHPRRQSANWMAQAAACRCAHEVRNAKTSIQVARANRIKASPIP